MDITASAYCRLPYQAYGSIVAHHKLFVNDIFMFFGTCSVLEKTLWLILW